MLNAVKAMMVFGKLNRSVPAPASAASAKVATTGNVPQVAFESVNSVQVIKLNYLNLMRPTEAEAWFAVSRSVVGEYRRQREEKPGTAK